LFRKIHVLRIKPGQKLMSDITDYCRQNDITSGVVLGIIGSVETARLGTPPVPEVGKPVISYENHVGPVYEWKDYTGPLSIISGTGTIAVMNKELVFHVHVLLSAGGTDNKAGHLVDGTVWATAEVVIGELEYQLRRESDPKSGASVLLNQQCVAVSNHPKSVRYKLP